MSKRVSYFCEDCGNEFDWIDFYLLYRKNDKIVEEECLMITSSECDDSDLQGQIIKTYCDKCEKIVKIYTVSDHYNSEDKTKYAEEIKEYLKHKRPRNTIKTFIEKFDPKNITCHKCENNLPSEYIFDKCPKCGSKKLNGIIGLAD